VPWISIEQGGVAQYASARHTSFGLNTTTEVMGKHEATRDFTFNASLEGDVRVVVYDKVLKP
jgi:hypothetical protein